MMNEVRFRNFKALREVDVTFESRLTVIVGPNGAGKTSLLQGIEVACNILLGKSRDNNILLKYTTKGANPADVSVHSTYTSNLERYSIDVVAALPGQNMADIDSPIVSKSEAGDNIKRYMFSTQHGWLTIDGQRASLPQLHLHIPVFLRFDTSALATPSRTNKVPQTVSPNGADLASTLWYMLGKERELFAQLEATFRQVIPNVERIRFEKAADAFADMILFDFKGASNVSAEHASTGTLHTLGLLAVILGPAQPDIILLDDIDHALHPKAQIELIKVLRDLLKQFPKLQIIATSHSLYVLHELEANEVRVMAMDPVDGRTVCAPLADHPDYKRWKETMSPGEFWSHVGEDWVLDAKNKKGWEPTTS